ncbi:Sugar transporter ERD6-like 16 [Acorus calamus]|uniref:Sugar transporter ERD6-like 16 n=1 Tax=Acorus calamus TaxID=4465 RepID=A0AAV9CUU3_ACOCL|nr:Sugar transporter ERD6-like 16 [Acorus calamus]
MAINEDVERGPTTKVGISEPLLYQQKIIEEPKSQGSIWLVILSTLVAVCGSFEFGSCVGYSAPTQSGIRSDLGLSLSEYAVFGSILTIGAMIGAVGSGRISDFLGRKGGALLLDIGRLLTGCGIGVLSYVLMIVSGGSIAYIVGTIVDWRALALTGLVPAILLLVGLFFVPESPRWLAKVGHQIEFEVALRKLRGKDADISEEASDIQDYIDTLQRLPKANILDLFQRKHARAVIVGVGLMVAQQFGGINGIGFYASEIFVSAGFPSGNLGTILMGVIQVPITALGVILMDKSGRRPLLMISATGTFLGCFLAGISFYLKVYLASFSLGMGGIPWLMMSEIFSMEIKGVAGSMVTLLNWFGSWIVSYAFNFLMSWSSSAKIVPETKGQTLEEIQVNMNSSRKWHH